MELGGLDTKRRASDGGFQRETGEEPAKRVRYSLDSEGSMERQNGVQVSITIAHLFHVTKISAIEPR